MFMKKNIYQRLDMSVCLSSHRYHNVRLFAIYMFAEEMIVCGLCGRGGGSNGSVRWPPLPTPNIQRWSEAKLYFRWPQISTST